MYYVSQSIYAKGVYGKNNDIVIQDGTGAR